jgi:heme/copper-type cytochrome/quinol oxidase subunit 1
MNESIQPDKLDTTHRVLVILWFALVSSVGIYFVISRLVPTPASDDSQVSMLSLVLAAMGLSLTILSFAIKQRFFTQAEQKQRPALVRAGLIIALALCETAALFGFVDLLVTGNRYYFVMFVIALIGMLFHFPRRNQLALASYRNIERN